MSALEIVKFGAGMNGTKRCAVHLGSVRVLVEPSHESDNTEALAVAERIADTERTTAAQRDRIADLEAQVKLLQAAVREARAVNEAAILGRRRFFGPVLLKPVTSDWAGEVWLLDPVKLERGRGLRFANVAEVHAMHPELWVVGMTNNGVLLDAWGES